MCHFCGIESKRLTEEKKLENGNSLKLSNGGLITSCKFCGERQQDVKLDGLSPYATPMISPTTSLSSNYSRVSSCSDISADVNSYDRETPLNMVRDIEIHSGDSQESKDNWDANTIGSICGETEASSCALDEEMDAQIWEPPEPDDPEDDVEGSVAYNDDDDECGDGTKWGEPSSLSHFNDEWSGSYKFKQEKEQAMKDVINGKFKTIVSQLLKSMGVVPSGDDEESWVDIVTSLSWEAALFLKPDAIDGKAMDPDGYVKVKCIASGSRSESQLIKGLVFKKHAAHKHMPAMYKNPRLLLISGVLGHSSSGLSSFHEMEEEKEHLKSLGEILDACHPNLVLVEKAVSRDVQESILAKGMTLVLDMKLHRLERVARCTGSPILSSDSLASSKLKHCDSFHFEKFVEEHAGLGEGGKRPSKTLMFLEGLHKRLGCTILLKGSHSDELKKIKCVVQWAVVMAYHLILETSFLVDQRSMYATIPFAGVQNVSPNNGEPLIVSSNNSSFDSLESTEKTALSTISISNGFNEVDSHNSNFGLEFDSALSFEPYNPAIFTGLSSISASIKKVIGNRFPLNSSSSYPTLSSYFGINGHTEITQDEAEGNTCSDEGMVDDAQALSLSPSTEEDPTSRLKDYSYDEDPMQSKDDANARSDPQSILVLTSTRNVSKGSICEQSHFSHIMFYRNFDIPLGKFLQDNLLNQKTQCTICGEVPEVHLYNYAHRNKQLTLQVKCLPLGKCLPGQAEGKLWMWSRCGKCKTRNGNSKSTKRVLLSMAARGLSFGKFLELGFCQHFLTGKTSNCGHSFDRDFLYFFGIGPMVAMFRYSLVTTYTVSLPPLKLEFSSSIRPDFFTKETENVYAKGITLFTEVESNLKKIKSQFEGSPEVAPKDLSVAEDMLKGERLDFEVHIQNVNQEHAYKLLSLNRLLWELLLKSCIWDQRLHSLLSPRPNRSTDKATDFVVKDTLIKGPAQENIDQIGVLDPPDDSSSSNDGFMSPTLSASRDLDDVDEWFWMPFMEIQEMGMEVKCDSISNNTLEHLPMARQLITEEGSRLHIPLGTGNCIVSDFEGELSSLIACALTFLKDVSVPTEASGLRSLIRVPTMASAQWSSSGSLDSDIILSAPSIYSEDSRFSSFDGLNLLESLVPTESVSPEVLMGVSKSLTKGKYSVICLYASQFRELRSRCCSSELDYIASLSRCRSWDAKGGKSKSFFAKTLDDRFIIKEIKKTEFESFAKFAPNYFQYMNQSYDLGNQTCLAKVLGIYQVVLRQSKNGREVRHDLMVMENLMFGRSITRQYDLKGALHARFNSGVDGAEDDVLLDQNFVNDMNSDPLYVSNTAKQCLQRAVWNDTTFLNSINVMDYSLLVGVDTKGGEVVCGIIDYLRQYTWDKQLETWVKSSLVPKNLLPTVISPKEYKKRFRKFMSTHLLSVPDHWCSERSKSV